MFTTWFTILVMALVLTVISLRHRNILLSLVASIGWFSLMAYNLEDPLVGIAQGSAIHQWMTMGFAALGVTIMLMWFRTRGREGMAMGEGGAVGTTTTASARKGLMDLDSREYRATANKALHSTRRKR